MTTLVSFKLASALPRAAASTASNSPRSSDDEMHVAAASRPRRSHNTVSLNDNPKRCARCGSLSHLADDCEHSTCRYCEGGLSQCHQKFKCFCFNLESKHLRHSHESCAYKTCMWCGFVGLKHAQDKCPQRGCRYCRTPKSELDHDEANCSKKPRAPCVKCGSTAIDHYAASCASCSNCGRHGHKSDDCKSARRVQKQAAIDRQLAATNCYRCGVLGHRMADCTFVFVQCEVCKGWGHCALECKKMTCERCNEIGHWSYRCNTPRCSLCRKFGHVNEECTQYTCFTCGETGHFSQECPNYDLYSRTQKKKDKKKKKKSKKAAVVAVPSVPMAAKQES